VTSSLPRHGPYTVGGSDGIVDGCLVRSSPVFFGSSLALRNARYRPLSLPPVPQRLDLCSAFLPFPPATIRLRVSAPGINWVESLLLMTGSGRVRPSVRPRSASENQKAKIYSGGSRIRQEVAVTNNGTARIYRVPRGEPAHVSKHETAVLRTDRLGRGDSRNENGDWPEAGYTEYYSPTSRRLFCRARFDYARISSVYRTPFFATCRSCSVPRYY